MKKPDIKIVSIHTGNIVIRGTENEVVDYLIQCPWLHRHVEIHYPGGLSLQPKNYKEVRDAIRIGKATVEK